MGTGSALKKSETAERLSQRVQTLWPRLFKYQGLEKTVPEGSQSAPRWRHRNPLGSQGVHIIGHQDMPRVPGYLKGGSRSSQPIPKVLKNMAQDNPWTPFWRGPAPGMLNFVYMCIVPPLAVCLFLAFRLCLSLSLSLSLCLSLSLKDSIYEY